MEENKAARSMERSARELGSLMRGFRDYAIFLLDPTGVVMSWNEGAYDIKGYSAEEIVGRSFKLFYTKSDLAAKVPDRLLLIAATEGRVEHEGWRVRKDGTLFWADVVISAMRDESGGVEGFLKVTRDLTERRNAEEKLRQSEERLRLMVESVSDYAIFMLDPAGVITSWNLGAERLKGYSAREVIGRHFSMFYPEEDVRLGLPEQELREAAGTGRAAHEGWRVRKDGTRFWAGVVLTSVKDAKGEHRGFAKVTRDMTERRRADAEVAARALQQTAAADVGHFAIQTRDLKVVIERVLAKIAVVLELEMAAFFALLPGGAALVLEAGVGLDGSTAGSTRVDAGEGSFAARALRSGEPVTVADSDAETRFALPPLVLAHGARSGIAVPVHRAGNAPFALLGAFSSSPRVFSGDETHFLLTCATLLASAIGRRDAEEQLRDAERAAEEERIRAVEAREAVRERDEFISVAAHELRTPLTALQLRLQGLDITLRKGFAQSPSAAVLPKVQEKLTSALRQTDRLGRLVEKLLDVSRIVRGRLQIVAGELDLAQLAARIVEDYREQAEAAGSPVTLRVVGSACGRWDRERMEQVLVNLLSNAIKYGASRPVEMTLDGTEASALTITVCDQGIGISAVDVKRVFERFERAAPVRHYGGLGLGLYITRHIVEAHGGSIEASSTPAIGSTFTVRLPRNQGVGASGGLLAGRGAKSA